AILSTLGLEGLLRPVQGMLNKILDFLPNLFTAILIGLIGWLVARFMQRVVTNLLEALGADRLSERVHLASVLGKQKLSGVLGLIVYILILIPILVAALQTLKLDAVTEPASRMLEMILAALPNIFAAALILVISYVIGRVVAGLISNLLEGIGFNGILARLGIGREISEGSWTPSSVMGYLVLVGIMLFALIEAADQLGFTMLSGIFSQFTVLAGHIFMGLIIFAIGLFLANLVFNTILATATAQSRVLAVSAKIAILVLAGAMALRHMGLADEIINLAFGLILGAIAIAVAIAFGIGGREIAGRELNEWISSMKSKSNKNQ
ncbi:MAG TPA: mechanosensitive ion channel, partial [Geobacteraceae bacterium]|nr:mechanosensitive ion channel [Geobacteraceae bacterium]